MHEEKTLELTSLPKTVRLFAILQLCLAFTLLCWLGGLPFMGDLFSQKAQMLLYQNIVGDATLLQKLNPSQAEYSQNKFARNQKRFHRLPEKQQQSILQEYYLLKQSSEKSFLSKLGKSIRILVFDLPSFELAWIVFAIVIALLLLLRIEGAAQVSWLLPAIALLYALNNQIMGEIPPPSGDKALFPTEQVIINNYLKQPLDKSIETQRVQLLQGWHLYLIKEWAKQTPATDPLLLEQQMEEGEYAFNLARLQALSQNVPQRKVSNQLNSKESIPVLILYILWNFIFACTTIQKSTSKPPSQQDSRLVPEG